MTLVKSNARSLNLIVPPQPNQYNDPHFIALAAYPYRLLSNTSRTVLVCIPSTIDGAMAKCGCGGAPAPTPVLRTPALHRPCGCRPRKGYSRANLTRLLGKHGLIDESVSDKGLTLSLSLSLRLGDWA